MAKFDYFVVFAEMRTGSNFLEANINMFDDLTCLGEAFNPHFIGYPDQPELLGLSQAQRDRDPLALIDAIKKHDGLAGFRFFNDHDPRALDACIGDLRCAKVILTRNPLDSYVSWKIAKATGQWKLTNVSHAKKSRVVFDPAEFEAHLEVLQGFQVQLMNALQQTGQTAFYIAYEDLQDVSVMNGLAMWLGVDSRISQLNKKLKKQNPASMDGKVANLDQMESALVRLDRFNLSRTPNFEPRRGPMIPHYVAAPEAPLLFMPIKSAPDAEIRTWMAGLDASDTTGLKTGFSQKSLRHWKRERPGHRSFTVLRHPLARAHVAFCERILATGDGSYPEIRKTLQKVHDVPLPDRQASPETDGHYGYAEHRAAFLAFLRFLKSNLSAQTATRVDGTWASQLAVLQGMSSFGLPDHVLREEQLRIDLALLAGQIGRKSMPQAPVRGGLLHERLTAIYDPEIESAAREAYGKDYTAFGFSDWSPH